MGEASINPKEAAFRESLIAAISKAVNNGMKTGEIVVTILELARISCEGSLMALHPDGRPEAKKLFVEVLDEMAKHLMEFEPPSVDEIERLTEISHGVLSKNVSNWDRDGDTN